MGQCESQKPVLTTGLKTQEIIITFNPMGNDWVSERMVLYSSATLPILLHTTAIKTLLYYWTFTFSYSKSKIWWHPKAKHQLKKPNHWPHPQTRRISLTKACQPPISQPQICTRLPHLFHPIPALFFSEHSTGLSHQYGCKCRETSLGMSHMGLERAEKDTEDWVKFWWFSFLQGKNQILLRNLRHPVT